MLKKRLVGWFILIPLCVILVIFALANRHSVSLHFDPLSSQSALLPAIELPMFVIIYFMLILGVVLGGVAVWFTQGANRKKRRQLQRENDKLTRELEAERQRNKPSRPALKQTPEEEALLDID